MVVAMVQVRVVGMPVLKPLVAMRVRVRLAGRVDEVVIVLMMRIVDVAVFVRQRLMDMLMRVPLGQVDRDADSHQHGGQ